MSRQAKTHITPEEYLAYERRKEDKNEYYDGAIYAMTGASRKHNLIAGNVFAELKRQLRDRPCETYISDMRVRIPAANIYTYPDVVVACDEPRFEDAEVDTLLNPILIVEILSKSTARYDRAGSKFSDYRSIPSFAEHLLVSQDERRVEHYVRQPDGRWLLTDFSSLEDVVQLDSIKCSLPLREIYDKVSFS